MGTEDIYLCPFCIPRGYSTDTKGHLYVNRAKGVYHCFKCKAEGRSSTLPLGLTLISNQQIPTTLSLYTPKTPGEPVLEATGILAIVAREYLKRRHLTESEIRRYGVRYSTIDHTIWFPIYGVPGGTPLWYQGRRLNGTYYNPKGCIYAKHTMFRTFGIPILSAPVPACVVCEGVFDAIAVGKVAPAVAALGKNISDSRIKSLRLVAKRVILLLDEETTKEATLMTLRMRKLGLDAIQADETKLSGDPGDTDVDTLREIIVEVLNAG